MTYEKHNHAINNIQRTTLLTYLGWMLKYMSERVKVFLINQIHKQVFVFRLVAHISATNFSHWSMAWCLLFVTSERIPGFEETSCFGSTYVFF
jgi:hypothetical protein